MIETILAKVGIPILINVLSEALGAIDNPITKGAAKALGEVDAAIKSGNVTQEQLVEINRHAEKIAQMQSEEYRAGVEQVNQSLRAEIASEDKYVRRMRPTFGYLMAITWAAQMLGVSYIMVFDTARAGEVMGALGSLSAIWGVGLSVLGIYVWKRSDEKKVLSSGETIYWR
jgi:hypothetical protein